MQIPSWLGRVKLDWSDFDEAGRVARDVVQTIAADRTALRRMVLATYDNATLRALAEKHSELNYIVLHDDLDSGLRVRLHRFSKGLEDIPHNHRFSFSSVILSGSYVHTLFALERGNDDTAEVSRWQPNQAEGTHAGTRLEEICITGLTPMLTTTQSAGSSYSMHHQSIHKTAMPHSDAFSLFIRGPAQKPCALQLQPESRSYRWKFGREAEAAEVIADRTMTGTEFDRFVESLEAAQVI